MSSDYTRRSLVASALGGMALTLTTGGCGLLGQSATIRYRMIVEVSTPKGLRTGSSVIESTIRIRRTFSDPRAISYDVTGEGVAVDLPGGVLFALLHNIPLGYDYPSYLFNNALSHGIAQPPLSRIYKPWEWIEEATEARRVKPAVVLKPIDYPTLIRFRNPSDITSMEVVDPEDLVGTFGSGFSLRQISIAITDDPVRQRIRNFMPNIRDPRFASWRLGFSQNDVRRHLNGFSFSRKSQ